VLNYAGSVVSVWRRRRCARTPFGTLLHSLTRSHEWPSPRQRRLDSLSRLLTPLKITGEASARVSCRLNSNQREESEPHFGPEYFMAFREPSIVSLSSVRCLQQADNR
jgi:hypothetical protein